MFSAGYVRPLLGRQEVQFYPALRTFKPWLKHLGMMVTRFLDYDVKCRCLGVFFLYLFQHLKGGFSIDRFALDADHSRFSRLSAP